MAIRFISDAAQFDPPAGTANDFIDWQRFADRVPIDFAGRPELRIRTDIGKLGFDIFIPNGHLARRTQDGGPSWAGSFTANEALLFTDFTPGPLQFSFKKPVRGAGTQINIADLVEHVSFSIAAFAGNTRIDIPDGGTLIDGGFNNRGDGSAPFLGVVENDAGAVPRITRIVISLAVLDHGYRGNASFAINRLRLVV